MNLKKITKLKSSTNLHMDLHNDAVQSCRRIRRNMLPLSSELQFVQDHVMTEPRRQQSEYYNVSKYISL
jgi:hypothetical protein